MMCDLNQTFQKNSWLDDTPDRKAFPQLSESEAADWLIIGAGFTGVAAARTLAQHRPDDRILLVDAGLAGEGSGSLSSGFLVSAGQFNGGKMKENCLLYQLGSVGLQSLRQQVKDNSIPCDWNESGRLIGARGESGQRSIKLIERVLNQIGSPYSWVHPDELELATGMEGYIAAIRQHESVLVNPALLLRGLIESLPENVEVFENSEVLKLAKNGTTRGVLEHGEVTARKVLVTNNAFALRLGLGRNRLIPMRTFVSVASVKGESAASLQLGNEHGWGITSPERVGSSLRRVGDRLMIRNSAFHGFNFEEPEKLRYELIRISQQQLDSIQARFPQQEFQIENTWSGVIGVTANAGQIFRDLGNDTYVSAGYNGHGIAQGTVSGELLAEMALGHQSKLISDIQQIKGPNWIPSGPFLPPSVNAYAQYLCWRFRDEI